jgi:hypothetical protein
LAAFLGAAFLGCLYRPLGAFVTADVGLGVVDNDPLWVRCKGTVAVGDTMARPASIVDGVGSQRLFSTSCSPKAGTVTYKGSERRIGRPRDQLCRRLPNEACRMVGSSQN